MIFVFLIVLIVALILANIFVAVLRPKESPQKGFVNPSVEEAEEPEVVAEPEKTEETALANGSINSINQKLTLMNRRMLGLERTVSALAKAKVDGAKQVKGKAPKIAPKDDAKTKKKLKDLTEFRDDAKIRLEVMEKELEKLKGKPLVEKKKLEKFDDKTEEKIKSLVYNTGKKN